MRGAFSLVLILGGVALCFAVLTGVKMPWEQPSGANMVGQGAAKAVA